MRWKWLSENQSDEKKNGNPKKRMGPLRSQKKLPKQFRDEDPAWMKLGRVALSWVGIVLAVILIMYAFRSTDETEYEISFTAFQQLLSDKKITEATIKKSGLTDYDFHGRLTQPMDIQTASGKTARNAVRIGLTLPYSNIDDKLIAT
ncbi:MAG: ATP-dependent metallopeptidase FtsH/Yme1/Tma family protein, partial [Bacteroidota bacterium]